MCNAARSFLIFGLGGVGLQAFHFIKAMHGEYPIAVDLREEVLDITRKHGALSINASDKNAQKKIKKNCK